MSSGLTQRRRAGGGGGGGGGSGGGGDSGREDEGRSASPNVLSPGERLGGEGNTSYLTENGHKIGECDDWDI